MLIPAFAVGRTQEILYELATHFDEWQLGDWQVFLDSPMAIEATRRLLAARMSCSTRKRGRVARTCPRHCRRCRT